MLRVNAPDAPAAPVAANDENPLNNNKEAVQKQKYVTQMEWFCYRLFPHRYESSHLFMSGKLLQEFIVDAWAITEQSHLTWVKLNQAKLCVYHHQGIA